MDNQQRDVQQSSSGTLNAFNSLIGTSNIDLSGNGNLIGIDPLFAGNGDFSLQENSPAIDAGSNDFLSAETIVDLAGNPRINGGTVDIGAFEFQQIIPMLLDSINRLHQQLSACDNQATTWQDSISNLNERLATYGSLNSLLNDSIGELHQQLIVCNNQNSSLSDSISALNSRIVMLLSDTALSHSDIAELRDSINRLHEQLANYNSLTTALSDSIEQLHQQFANQNCLITALNDSIGNLHIQLTACNSQNSLLQDSIGTLNQAIVEWFEVTENLLDSIDWLRQALVDCENSNNTNIVGEHASSPLQVFPNPVTDKLHITHEWQSGDVVELLDMNGRRLFSAQPNNYQFTIDMTPFPNGTYILRIGNRVAKIVKR